MELVALVKREVRCRCRFEFGERRIKVSPWGMIGDIADADGLQSLRRGLGRIKEEVKG